MPPTERLRVLGVADGRSINVARWARRLLERGHEVSIVSDRVPPNGTAIDGVITSIEGASMNVDGVFAFVGELDDEEGTRGIFRGDARPALPQVRLIVRVGAPAPGVTGGTFGRFPPSLVPSINLATAVAFRVTIGGDATGAGVFVADPDGTVRKVVTTREELETLVEGDTTLAR